MSPRREVCRYCPTRWLFRRGPAEVVEWSRFALTSVVPSDVRRSVPFRQSVVDDEATDRPEDIGAAFGEMQGWGGACGPDSSALAPVDLGRVAPESLVARKAGGSD